MQILYLKKYVIFHIIIDLILVKNFLQMPKSVKDESEHEGDEMSHVSNDSNATSSASESSEDHSDSDDSSEMDEEACEKRKSEVLENMSDIERQFYLIREK